MRDPYRAWQRKNQESLLFTDRRIRVQKLKDFEILNKWIIGIVCIIFYDMFLRFADGWDEEDEDVIEEVREVIEVAATGNGLILRQRVQVDLLHWLQNYMLV